MRAGAGVAGQQSLWQASSSHQLLLRQQGEGKPRCQGCCAGTPLAPVFLVLREQAGPTAPLPPCRRPGQGHALAPVHARAEPVPLDAQLHRAQLHLQQHRPGEEGRGCGCGLGVVQGWLGFGGAGCSMPGVGFLPACPRSPLSALSTFQRLLRTDPGSSAPPLLAPQVGVFASAESSQAGDMVDVLCTEMQVRWARWLLQTHLCCCRLAAEAVCFVAAACPAPCEAALCLSRVLHAPVRQS